MTEPLLACSGLRIERAGRAVLADLTVAVERGDRIAVLGANGAGKSSLLGALAGLLPVGDGMVRRSAGLVVGWLPQRLDLPPMVRTTVSEFVATGRCGLSADPDAVAAAISTARLDDLAHRDLARLSGGERQRAVLARALARRADLLLADEPAAGLDADAAEALADALAGVPAKSAAIVVSHDPAWAASWASRRWIIAQGRLHESTS